MASVSESTKKASPTAPRTDWQTPVLSVIAVLALASLAACVYLAFFVAPVESQMGIVQKIFYFHVPSAYGMYVGFGLCALASVVYLITRSEKVDAVAVAAAEVGLLFCVIVLVTGPLWGRKAWGVFWVWDPRLTSTLLAGLIFAAYTVLRSFGSGTEAERKLASALGVLGLIDLPIVHFSVQRWSGQHPTVITKGGGGLHPDMVPALIVGFVAFTLLAVLLIWLRARAERIRQRASALEIEAAELGLREDT